MIDNYLYILEIGVLYSGACGYDSLTIIDGSKRTDFCGSAIPVDYTSKGNKILLRFVSDSSYELAGFKLSFSTVEGPKGMYM